jgi:hypothetical protein
MIPNFKNARFNNMHDSAEETDQNFFRALVVEDQLGFVVKAHINIEHTLRRLIEAAIPYPEHLDIDQISYAMAIRLAASVGLNSRFKGPLQAFGRLRNKFAHQLNAQITSDEADKLYKSFATEDQRTIQRLYAEMQTDKIIEDLPWENRDAKDKITFCVVVLRAALLTAADALSEGPPELTALLNQMAGKFTS